MTPDDEHIQKYQTQIARELADQAAVRRARRAKQRKAESARVEASRPRSPATIEQQCAARHAEHMAMAAAIRAEAIEATWRAYEAAERLRQAERLAAESELMWDDVT